MTIRELCEAVPDEHKDDILCVYDEDCDTVEAEEFWLTRTSDVRSRCIKGMVDVVVVY